MIYWRGLLGAGVAALVGGCAWPDLKRLGTPVPNERIIGDVHARPSNAADLPIAGFMQCVLLPERLPTVEVLWPALIALGRILKLLASSARAWQNSLFPAWGSSDGDAITLQRYADDIADEIKTGTKSGNSGALSLDGADTSAPDSLATLALVLA